MSVNALVAHTISVSCAIDRSARSIDHAVQTMDLSIAQQSIDLNLMTFTHWSHRVAVMCDRPIIEHRLLRDQQIHCSRTASAVFCHWHSPTIILPLVYCPADDTLFKVGPEIRCSGVSSCYCCYGNHTAGSKPVLKLFIVQIHRSGMTSTASRSKIIHNLI